MCLQKVTFQYKHCLQKSVCCVFVIILQKFTVKTLKEQRKNYQNTSKIYWRTDLLSFLTLDAELECLNIDKIIFHNFSYVGQ